MQETSDTNVRHVLQRFRYLFLLLGVAFVIWKLGRVLINSQDLMIENVVEAILVGGLSPLAIWYLARRGERMAAELERQEARFRLLAENAKDMVYRYRVFPNRGFEYVSPASKQVYGFTPEELYASPGLVWKNVHPDDQAKLSENEGWDTGSSSMTLRVFRKDGSLGWVELNRRPIFDEAGKLIAVEGIGRDITERKKTEALLLQTTERLRLTLDNLAIIAYELDADGKFILERGKGLEKLGRKPDAVVGQSIFDLCADYPDIANAVRRALDGEPQEIEVEQGNSIWASTYVPLVNERGEVDRVFGTAVDITERKHAERRLQAFTDELERSNRELQDFAYVASHDLQEPLRKIQAFGDRLKTKCADSLNEQGLDYLRRMQEAAGRMQTLVQDLLSFSRVTSKAKTFERVDLRTVAEEVVSDLVTAIARSQGHVEIGDLPTIDADHTQMHQLLQNLIANGLKYHGDEPPIVKISGTIVKSQQTPQVGEAPPSDRLELTVEDNGIGFDEKYLDRIFTIFQRLHSRSEYEGTGVGLAICRRIAERHRGGITATSAPGEGARFVVTLPVTHKK